jgi:hypothetical protein
VGRGVVVCALGEGSEMRWEKMVHWAKDAQGKWVRIVALERWVWVGQVQW